MDKFLLILVFIIKILVIIVAPILIFIFRNKSNKYMKYCFGAEIIALLVLIILYIIGFSYVTDSNISNIVNLKILNESVESESTNIYKNIEASNNVLKIEADTSYKTHRNDPVYYYNSFERPLSTKKIECENEYDYLKYYSDIITSTSMLLSSYLEQDIDPIEIYNKAYAHGIIKCGEPINKDEFFGMIFNEYRVYFNIIKGSDLENFVLNGKLVLLETIGNGQLSCNQTYYLIYNINNKGEYLLLDPNNKSYSYICPDGSAGFGNALKPNYNEQTFSYSDIIMDTSRLIVVGGVAR